MALGPTQPPIQWVLGSLLLGVKRPGREADHSLPSSAEVKECVKLYLHSLNTPSWRGDQLRHRDNFTCTSTFTLIWLGNANGSVRNVGSILCLWGKEWQSCINYLIIYRTKKCCIDNHTSLSLIWHVPDTLSYLLSKWQCLVMFTIRPLLSLG
jgi:hypothetical protein